MDALFDRKILFENLRTIDQAEISGALKLSTGSDDFYIYFQSGEVVFAMASLLGGAHSMELSREQALQLGYFTTGRLSFNGSTEPEQRYDWRLRAAELVLDAARKIKNADQLYGEIGDLGQILQPVFDLENRTRILSLTEEETTIISAIEESISITDLIAKVNSPAVETLRSIYALMSAGILDRPSLLTDYDEVEFEFAEAAPSPEPAQQQPVSFRHTGSLPKVIPTARAVPMTEPVAAQPSCAAPDPNTLKRQKIDTGKLQALAGVKIRSSGGREQSNETIAESTKYYQQGCAMVKAGNIAAGEALLRKTVSLDPENPLYLFQLGRLLSKMPKKQKEAEGLLLKACGNDATAVEPRLALAELYEKFGMKARAEAVLKGVLNIDPKHEGAKNRLKQLQGGYGSWKEEISGFFTKKKS